MTAAPPDPRLAGLVLQVLYLAARPETAGCLCEPALRGRRELPAEVLAALEADGDVVLRADGSVVLTAAGEDRAAALLGRP